MIHASLLFPAKGAEISSFYYKRGIARPQVKTGKIDTLFTAFLHKKTKQAAPRALFSRKALRNGLKTAQSVPALYS
ncbi:hypothetical protein ASJ35_07105 [Ruthenibacterium lactatiformans]|jgi:hypothetical protein|uniref:Uncharacterized protein n=1 Tax=Ruthenibacterium lactatiformans TaxID=1550024 RepID=A0A0W7TSS2_9FIRM|nr:hypothetical protein ASJ35_07105 [Ruthenibacterium lactatiformans]RJW82568.1 hypothetical protein DXA32_04360 [Subdoligranulum sp. OF01-18]